MTLLNSHYQSTPMKIAKNPGSLTPFVAGNCQEPFTFTRIASLLYYIDSPENREGYGKPDLHYTSEIA